MEVAAEQGGESDAVDKAAVTAELPPLWMWATGCGEGLPPLTRPWGGRGVAVVDKAVG